MKAKKRNKNGNENGNLRDLVWTVEKASTNL